MSLLSRQAIAKKVAASEIRISPTPRDEDYDSDAVDVHLGVNVYEWVTPPSGATISIALWKKPPDEFSYRKFSGSYLRVVPPDNFGIVTLRPHTFYLADLSQHTTLPSDIAMHVQGKSSLARLGVLVHLTAPHAHAGWSGRLTLEIYNLGPFNIELKPGMPIGQLTFWTVEDPENAAALPTRQFDNQQDAKGASGGNG